MKITNCLKIVASLPVAFLPATCLAQAPANVGEPGGTETISYEQPPVFVAADILTPALVTGPNHRVRASAPSDGYLIHFTVDSDFGTYTCVGRRELEKTVAEIQAIATLVAVSKGDLFAEGLKQSLEAPIDAAKNIIEDPRESIRRVPQTVGHFFNKLGSSIGNASRSVDERISNASEDGDAGAAIADTGKGIGKSLKSVAGFDKAKLNCARQLGIDPYSENERLQAEMEKVAWAFFAGGLPLRIGAAAASGGVSVAITSTKVIGLPDDIYDATPGELALQDRRTLSDIGVTLDKIDAVFLNDALGVSLRHSVVQSLASLPDGTGRVEVVSMLADAREAPRLAFLSEVLRLLAERHRANAYETIGLLGRLPVGIAAGGAVEVIAPVDHISWTESVAALATRSDMPSQKRLILLGKISAAAATHLRSDGWTIQQ